MAGLMDAIGKSGFRWLVLNAGAIEDANCDCPDPTIVIPVEYDWIHDVNFLITDGGFTSDQDWTEGVGWGSIGTAQYDYMPQITKFTREGGFGAITYFRAHLEWPALYADGAGNRRMLVIEGAEAIGTEIWAGQPVVSKVINAPFTEYDSFVVLQDWQFTHANPIGGNRLITRLIIAGTGDDPFPDLPEG